MKKFLNIFVALGVIFSFTLSAFAAADTKPPSDVENLKAVAMNGAVDLSWDPATDDTKIAGYQLHYGLSSVTKSGQDYDNTVDVKDVTKYTIDGLTNDKKYYFSVTAYDAAENESLSWAIEASATPKASLGKSEDKVAPTVKDAEAISEEEVKVVFSEAVVLPKEDPQDAFSIENEDSLELLTVNSAELDEDDKSNSTVILGTDKQVANQDYKLTVGIDIKDKGGNPIVSGTSDTAKFAGSSLKKSAEDTTGPKLTKVEVVDNTHIILTFDKTVVLSIDPATNFKIAAVEDSKKTLQVLGVKLGKSSEGVDDATAVITTGPQEKTEYTVTVLGLKDENDNEIGKVNNSGKFEGAELVDGGTTNEDVTAPKDVAKFIASTVMNAGKYVVNLKWVIPEENLDDVVEQVLYQSNDKGGNYEKKTSVESGIDEYAVEGLESGEYWFKITQKDQAGNESKGIIAKVKLAETGPGVVGLIAASLLIGNVVTKRKRKNS